MLTSFLAYYSPECQIGIDSDRSPGVTPLFVDRGSKESVSGTGFVLDHPPFSIFSTVIW